MQERKRKKTDQHQNKTEAITPNANASGLETVASSRTPYGYPAKRTTNKVKDKKQM
jgi:hypothetical protein